MRYCNFALAVAAALFTSTVFAHGPQIQVTNTGNKIITREVLFDVYNTAVSAPKSVYVMPIAQAVTGNPATAFWTVLPDQSLDDLTGITANPFGPGLAYGMGQTFTSGYSFRVNFMDALQRWDGSSSFVYQTEPGQEEELGAFRGDNQLSADQAVTTDSGPFQGLQFNPISSMYDGTSHSSMRFRMRGDGLSALVEPDDGIYLLNLQVTSSQPGLAPSDVFSFVLYKGVQWGELSAAISSLGVPASQVQVMGIPEPATEMLVAFGALLSFYGYRTARLHRC